jgi:spermidine/putrescine-binding protein
MRTAKPVGSRVAASCLLLCLAFSGCGRGPGQRAAPAQDTAVKVANRTLVLYNWEEYIGSATVAGFEQETGIDVQELYFTDEDESMGAVQADLAAFDLVVIGDDLVREMRRAKILAPLHKSKIPNLKNLGERFLNPYYDPELKYSVPYMWGSTGMVINKKYIKEDRDSWQVLFDPRYKGKIAMLPDINELLAVACKRLGYSLNTQDPRELARVRELLLEQKKLLKGYLDYVVLQDLLVREELWAAHLYSGEGTRVMAENENLAFVLPKEGARLWIDTFVIPRAARHKEEAHQFLNYILRPEVNAAIASELWYATADEKAEAFMDPAVLKARSVYPLPEMLARCEYLNTPAEAFPILSSIWEELQE